MKRETTSEEKLLQLIRRKSAPKTVPKKTEQKSPDESSSSQGKNSFGWDEKSVAGFLGIGTQVLVILSCGFVVFSVMQTFFIRDTRSVPILEKEASETAHETEQFTLPAQPAFDNYAEALSKRDLFRQPGTTTTAAGTEETAAFPALRDLSSEYQLVGILLDKNPTAVVENRQSGRTLFLPQGGVLDNGVVEQIEEGRVIVNFNGQRLELRQ